MWGLRAGDAPSATKAQGWQEDRRVLGPARHARTVPPPRPFAGAPRKFPFDRSRRLGTGEGPEGRVAGAGDSEKVGFLVTSLGRAPPPAGRSRSFLEVGGSLRDLRRQPVG